MKMTSQPPSEAQSVSLDQEQLRAVELLLSAPMGVITGGPGTGKTTCLGVALDQLDARGFTYALCAPTGKAARRMSEATHGREARTIHRLLEWSPSGFRCNQLAPLGESVVVVDESSMLDVQLAASLLRAFDVQRTRGIFVGDVNQLPPVGPGAFFRDLIASAVVPVVRLLTLHRSAQQSWICRNAPKVLLGAGVELVDTHDFEWWQLPDGSAHYISQTVVDLVKKLRNEGTDLGAVQVLTPMKEREGGVFQLNEVLQKFVNPKPKGAPALHSYNNQQIYVGDRVIHTRNNYELGVMNGEIGHVLGDVGSDGLRVKFSDGTVVHYKTKDTRDLQLAYALTIHRYQGSEIDNCIVVCHSTHGSMLTRQLFYTAITRAKKRVFVVGDATGMKRALATFHDAQRKTLLQQRLRGEL